MAAVNYNGLMTPILSVGTDGIKASTEALYGPYASVDEAYQTITDTLQGTPIPIGLTVGIATGSSITEYWFNGGTEKANLVPKITGGSGGYSIFTINGVTSDTNTFLNQTFGTAQVGDHVVDTLNGGVYIMYAQGQWVKLNGTILTDSAPTISRITNAHVLSYK